MDSKQNEPGAPNPPDDEHANSLDVALELEGTRSNVADREDVPPDGGYGWVRRPMGKRALTMTWQSRGV